MTTPCPDIAEIRRFVASGAVEDSPTADHVETCDSCRELVVQLQTASSGVETVEAGPDDPSATRTISGDQRGAASPLPDRVGAVEVGETIGRGGMGVVHRGRDRMLSRDVAVKFLLNVVAGEGDPRFEEFLGGARNAAKVRHPNLVTMHQACLVEQTPCLIMELIDGPTLGRLIHNHSPLSPGMALRILDDTASAVAALHEHDVLHRDIKPGNILFDREGRLFVTDFGLACPRPGGSHEAHRTRKIAGSPPYMAPEMFQGTISTRTDVYALGVVAFELVTGVLPFSGTLPEVQRAHESTPPPLDMLRSADVPAAMVDLIERAMHKREIYRFKSAIEFQRALRDVDQHRASDLLLRQLVQAGPADRDASASDAEPKSSGSSSYFDRLTEIASEKQATRGQVPPPRDADGDEDEETRVEQHVPCAGCGRDLLGDRLTGACMRCHTPIEDSRHTHMLSAASHPVLERWRRGLGRVHISFSIALAGLVGLALARIILGVLWPAMAGWISAHAAGPLCVAVWGSAVGFLVAGLFDLTAIEPRCKGVHRPRGRNLMRVTGLLGVALLLGEWTAILAGPVWLVTATHATGCAVVIVALVGAMLRAGTLARRADDEKLAGSCAVGALLVAATAIGALTSAAAALRASPDEQMPFLHAFTLAAAGLALLWACALVSAVRQHVETIHAAPPDQGDPTAL